MESVTFYGNLYVCVKVYFLSSPRVSPSVHRERLLRRIRASRLPYCVRNVYSLPLARSVSLVVYVSGTLVLLRSSGLT